jgi:hypothetical protein
VLATLMLLIAASCTARLAIGCVRGRDTETDADGLHVLMGVAMAGMLEPRLSPVPDAIWRAVFAAAAAWFAWQAIRAGSRRAANGWRCANPAPHAVESAAMVYMLLPARQAGYAPAMGMPGMSGPAAIANPALALVLALFMLGYILWAADQLAGLSRASATVGGQRPAAAHWPATTTGTLATSSPPSISAAAARGGTAAAAALAPRFAACYKITMGIAMGYMLITML